MSDLPPDPTPPPIEAPSTYAAYPRQQTNVYGDADRLEALAKGYFALNWALLGQIVFTVVVALTGGLLATTLNLGPLLTLGPIYALLLVGVTWITLGPNRNIARGMGWKPGSALTSSILMAIGSVICGGLLSYIVMQQIVGSELKKYGLRYGFLRGFRKREIQATVTQLRADQGFRFPSSPQ